MRHMIVPDDDYAPCSCRPCRLELQPPHALAAYADSLRPSVLQPLIQIALNSVLRNLKGSRRVMQ